MCQSENIDFDSILPINVKDSAFDSILTLNEKDQCLSNFSLASALEFGHYLQQDGSALSELVSFNFSYFKICIG